MNALPDEKLHEKLHEKLELLRGRLRALGSVVVGFSGGVDSSFLLRMAVETLGDRALAVVAVSPSLPARDLADARTFAAAVGARLREVASRETEDADYAKNAPDRCFHCKAELVRVLRAEAVRDGASFIAYGAIHDDLGDYRPGMEAARAGGAVAPLLDVGLTKAEIREASRAMGLPTWDRPASACLSSRIPYGTPVTPERLRQVETAEEALRALGLRVVRVRHLGDRARVEVGVPELEQIAAGGALRSRAEEAVRAAGYAEVEFDPRGYRSGSLNEALVAGPGETDAPPRG